MVNELDQAIANLIPDSIDNTGQSNKDQYQENLALNQFEQAMRDSDIGTIVQLIEKGLVDVNQTRIKGYETPLTIAARKGLEESCRYLLNKGADIEATGSHNDTALVFAARDEHLATVNLLIEKGCNINHQGSCGGTALIFAADQGFLDIVDALLKSGADTEIKGDYSETALISAVIQDRFEVAKRLLAYGADIDAKDNSGNTVFSYVRNSKNFEEFNNYLLNFKENQKLSNLIKQTSVTQLSIGF